MEELSLSSETRSEVVLDGGMAVLMAARKRQEKKRPVLWGNPLMRGNR